MKKTVLSILIVVLLALLLTVTTAFAKAERIGLEGTEDVFIAGAPGRAWEADGSSCGMFHLQGRLTSAL